MAKRDPVWLGIMKLGFWIGGVLLFFRFVMYLIAFLGGDAREFWVPLAGASTVFLALYTKLVNHLRLPDDTGNKLSAFPVISAESGNANSIATIKGETTMSDDPNTGNRIVHINNAPSYHNNTPGGMINFCPVTLTQHFGMPQGNSEAANTELRDRAVEPVADADAIDIGGLLDFSTNFRPQGVSRNTIDNILRRGSIKPCATGKEGRTVRYLYPGKESKAAITDYFTDKGK